MMTMMIINHDNQNDGDDGLCEYIFRSQVTRLTQNRGGL